MPRNYFDILNLPAETTAPEKIRAQFNLRRATLLRELGEADAFESARRELDLLYEAYGALRDAEAQAAYLEQLGKGRPLTREEKLRHLARLIANSLEGHLLRYTRRQHILSEGRRLGFSEFHTHLLIAQVQFGEQFLPTPPAAERDQRRTALQAAARLSAAGLLGMAMFFAMIRWLAV